MRPYEVVLIFDSSVEESTVDSAVERIGSTLSAKDGKLGQVEKWGRRRFAYEMKHRWEGYYTLVEFTASTAAVADVDRQLLLSDDVLRHKIVRIPDAIAGRQRQASKSEAAESAENAGASV